MCVEQEHKLRSKNTNPEIKKNKNKNKNKKTRTQFQIQERKKKKKKHPHTHTFFPSLKLTQKNNTQISNVTTPTMPLSLSSLKNVIPTTTEAKNPNPIQKPQSKTQDLPPYQST